MKDTDALGEVLADNPDFADIVSALAAAPDEPEALAARPIAPRVVAAIAARRRAARLLRRRLSAAAAAAAAVAAVVAAPALLPPRPGAAVSSAGPAQTRLPGGVQSVVRGDDPLAPAAAALAVMHMASAGERDGGEGAAALERAVSFLRAVQNPDGSFGVAASAGTGVSDRNLALCAAALLKLYETGRWPELFTPVDGAITAIRERLAALSAAPPREGEVYLAAALAVADDLEWPDSKSGAMRNALRRFSSSDNPAFAPFAAADSLSGGRKALGEALRSLNQAPTASLQGSISSIFSRSAAAVKPNFSASTPAGADSPKWSSARIAPSGPTHFSQPRLEPASNAIRRRHDGGSTSAT